MHLNKTCRLPESLSDAALRVGQSVQVRRRDGLLPGTQHLVQLLLHPSLLLGVLRQVQHREGGGGGHLGEEGRQELR